jgi:hypothetical protein
MATYRKPTEKESEKLNMSRKKMIEGIMGEKDIFSRMMPTMAKSARDDIRAAKAMRESVPAMAREGEAYQDAGYKKGGKVKKFAEGGNISDDEARNAFIADIMRSEFGSKKTPLPSEGIKRQTENPIIRKAKDVAASVMSRTPSAMAAKKGMEMARKYPRGSEGESAFEEEMGMKKGGKVKDPTMSYQSYSKTGKPAGMKTVTVKKASGGSVSSASKRADGCAVRGKTKA